MGYLYNRIDKSVDSRDLVAVNPRKYLCNDCKQFQVMENLYIVMVVVQVPSAIQNLATVVIFYHLIAIIKKKNSVPVPYLLSGFKRNKSSNHRL